MAQIIVQYGGNLGQLNVVTVLRSAKNQPLPSFDFFQLHKLDCNETESVSTLY